MESVAINRISNAKVYIDGNILLGQVEEFDLPDVKFKFSDYKALGMTGSAEFFEGLEKLEARIKFNALYQDVWAKAAVPGKTVNLMMHAQQQEFQSSGRAEPKPVVIHVSGAFKNVPLGKFKQQEPIDVEMNMAIYYVHLIIAGQPVMEIDILSNIYKVNGTAVTSI